MRGMNLGVASGSLCIKGLFGIAATLLIVPAVAGEIDATVTVSPGSQGGVSLSLPPSEPVASYVVTVSNTGTSNTIQRARFHAVTSVTGGDAGAAAQFKSSTGYTCTPTNLDRTAVSCEIGILPAGVSSTPFTLSFSSPTSGTAIAMHWTVDFDNGGGLSNGNGDASPISLNPIDPNLLKSDVPALTSLEFFTGRGVANPVDTWVTRVTIFSTSTATQATIEENQNALNFCANGVAADLLTCSYTSLSIPGATFGTPGDPIPGQFLKITLLRDASTIARGAKISSAKIFYSKDGVSLPVEVLPCSMSVTGGPTAGVPCEDVSKRIAYPRKNSQKTPVTAGYEGDWSFTVYAADNGRYEQ
jgi:hypothetical protein